VWVSDEEIARLAQERAMSDAAFRSVYTRSVGSGVVLRQKSNQDCVFFGERGCEVYALRPKQCRAYPFWQAIVHSREDWELESRACPGIGTGDLHAGTEVAASAAEDGIPVDRTRMRLDPR
jgi:Fe-S-cluster containining protein